MEEVPFLTNSEYLIFNDRQSLIIIFVCKTLVYKTNLGIVIIHQVNLIIPY